MSLGIEMTATQRIAGLTMANDWRPILDARYGIHKTRYYIDMAITQLDSCLDSQVRVRCTDHLSCLSNSSGWLNVYCCLGANFLAISSRIRGTRCICCET
jgi:hypothetical protein